jgi:hypothetical protein
MSALLAMPWHISRFEVTNSGKNRMVMGADNFSIAYVSGRSEDEHVAIANLIAAAPDMLAALQALVAPHYDEDGVVDPSTAITIVGENRRGEKQLKGSFMEALERARAAIARATPTAEGVA